MSRTNSTVAKPPFDIRSADTLIRTSDNVDFYLYRAVLILASPFFMDMFSMAQPGARTDTTVVPDNQNPIPIAETSQTFDRLMRLCYPVDDPIIDDLSLLENVLEAAIKYQMSEAMKLSQNMLRKFVQTHPLDVFAISCKLHVEEEARHAAEVWKAASSFDGPTNQFERTLVGASFSTKMKAITAGSYYRLLHYLRTKPPGLLRGNWDPVVPSFTRGGDPTSTGATNLTAARSSARDNSAAIQAKYTLLRSGDTTMPDAVLLSRDGVKFPVHSAVLRAASAGGLLDSDIVLGSDTVDSQQNSNHDVTSTPITFPIDLPGDVLAELVRLCYPLERLDLVDLSLLCAVYDAAEKWNLTRIVLAIKAEFGALSEQHPNPTSLYCIAVRQGWRDQATHVARIVARKGVQHLYAAEMETIWATAYYHLLQFCHNFCLDAHGRLTSLVPESSLQPDQPPPSETINVAIVAHEIQKRPRNKAFNHRDGWNHASLIESLSDLSNKWEDALQASLSQVRLQWVDSSSVGGK